jgi:hypothetical protein
VANAPIFIVGCARSGTSLLRNLLRAHPRITFPGESHFIPELYRAYGDPETSRQACKLGERILKLWWVRKWELSIPLESFSPCRSFREVVGVIYEAYARKERKVRWGDKTPRYVLAIPTLLEVFPDCQIIHIYRDGRDVALSQLKHPSGLSRNVFVAAEVWKQRVGAGRMYGARLPADQYMEVRYESLITETEPTMRRVCGFLHESFAPEVLRPDFLDRSTPGLHFGPKHPLDVSRSEIVGVNQKKWRQQMSLGDRQVFESVAGPLLEELGYEVEGLSRTIPPLERRAWRAQHWFRFLLTRLDTAHKRQWVPSHLRIRWAIIRHRLRSSGVVD